VRRVWHPALVQRVDHAVALCRLRDAGDSRLSESGSFNSENALSSCRAAIRVSRGAELSAFETVARQHIDMQFEDVRLLLRLPRKGSNVGANFATAAVLFTSSPALRSPSTRPSWKALKGKAGGSGERFRGALSDHFPFAEITIPKKTTIDVFYKYSRNPLAHSFGLGDPKLIEVQIAKNALTRSGFPNSKTARRCQPGRAQR